MPIHGKPPIGPVKGLKSGAQASVGEGEWEAPPQHHPGWVRASASAASYPAVFEVGETLAWNGGSGVLTGVSYDEVRSRTPQLRGTCT